MSKNYYDILGVNKDASTDDIRKAFKKLSIKYHPDKHILLLFFWSGLLAVMNGNSLPLQHF